MGNGAFKSKRGRGTLGRGKVRIMLPDGNFLVLSCPVEVSEVMVAYPNHMVVHCESQTRISANTSGGSKITIMHPDQELKSGEDYILHLVPPQYRKVIFRTLSQPSPHVVKKKQPKPRVLRLLSRHNLAAFFPRRDGRGKGSDGLSLSDLINHETEPQICVFTGWQPSLEGIPECSAEEEE